MFFLFRSVLSDHHARPAVLRVLLGLMMGVLLLSLPGAVWAQSSALDIFNQANTAYEAGEFESAIDLYESLVSGGVVDSHVYFNLGNSYYRINDLGRALLNYRRAQRISPRDTDLIANMALVRAQRVDIQGDETGILEGMAALTTGIVTAGELSWSVFMVWALWFFLLTLAILVRRWREALRVPLAVLAVAALVVLLLLGSRAVVTANTPAGVVVSGTARIFTGPGETYLEIFQLHTAAEVNIRECQDGWVRFSLPDGRQGWMIETALAEV